MVFSSSVFSTRQSMGNRKNGRPADSSPSTVQENVGKPACHAHVPSIDMLACVDEQSPARKFEAQLPQSRGENHAQNAIDEPQFCHQQRPIGWMIRSGNTTINHNIVSIYIFGVFSSLVTNRLVHCSSHVLSHRPRPFFAIFDTG